MNEHEQYAQVDMTFSQMEGAIESFVETAHLAGLNVDDLLALLDAGLNIKEIIEIIASKVFLTRRDGYPSEPVESRTQILWELPYAPAR